MWLSCIVMKRMKMHTVNVNNIHCKQLWVKSSPTRFSGAVNELVFSHGGTGYSETMTGGGFIRLPLLAVSSIQ